MFTHLQDPGRSDWKKKKEPRHYFLECIGSIIFNFVFSLSHNKKSANLNKLVRFAQNTLTNIKNLTAKFWRTICALRTKAFQLQQLYKYTSF